MPDLGDVAVKALTPERVRSWYAGLDAAYPTRNGQVYALLKSIMATAVSDRVVAVNPCQIKVATNVNRKREPVILTVEELANLASSDKLPDRYRVLVLLAAWCGLRWGEVIELRRRDVGADGCSRLHGPSATVAGAGSTPPRPARRGGSWCPRISARTWHATWTTTSARPMTR